MIARTPRTADPNLLYFASSERHIAKKFLEDPGYAWLNQAAKDYILDHLDSNILNGFRVQDPKMHTPPQLMTSSMVHYSAVMDLMTAKREG